MYAKSITELSAVSKDSRTIVVCGAGNASHVCVSEFSSNGFTVDVFAPFQSESERWNAAIAKTGGDLIVDNPDGSQTIGRPRLISIRVNSPSLAAKSQSQSTKIPRCLRRGDSFSKNPADTIPGADIIVLPLPEFSLEPVLTAENTSGEHTGA